MQHLDAALWKYTESTGHEMEDLMLKHPFNIKYFNNYERYPCYRTSASSARSEEYLTGTTAALTGVMKSERAPYSPGWTVRTFKFKVRQSDAEIKLCTRLPREMVSSPPVEILKT